MHDDRKEFVASISNHSQLASESSGPPRYGRFRELQVIRSTPLEARRRLRPGALGVYPFIPNGKVTHCTDPYRNMSGQRLRMLQKRCPIGPELACVIGQQFIKEENDPSRIFFPARERGYCAEGPRARRGVFFLRRKGAARARLGTHFEM